MIFGGIQRTSTIDFPGSLSCVLFVRGCNLDCFYCHNRELLSLEGATVSKVQIMDFLHRRQGLLDGVVISGGEPTLYKDLPELLVEIKALGYRTKLDTNGQRPEMVRLLLEARLLDYAAVDWKALPEACKGVLGSSSAADNARQTIDLLFQARLPFEVRTTLYPGLSEKDLVAMAAMLPPLPCYRLNFFHPPYNPKEEDVERLKENYLTPTQIEALAPKLLELQPNLVWNKP